MPGMVNGKPIEPTIFMAVLYDPGTGQIAHFHRVELFDKKQKISKAHVEGRAKEMATRQGWDVTKLKTLHVDHSKLQRGARYGVDIKSRKLIQLAQPPMPVNSSALRAER